MEYPDLDRLLAQLDDAVNASDPQKGYWKELWSLVKEIGGGFKGTRYPVPAEREKAWDRFQKLVSKAKARDRENRLRIEEKQREWQDRQDRSRRSAEKIQSRASGSRPATDVERTVADIVLLPGRLIASVLFALVGDDLPSRSEEIKQELLRCNERLREAWEMFKRIKDDLLPGDRNQAYESLQKARGQLNQAWTRWKEAKTNLRETKRREWEQRQRMRETRQAERRDKHSQFVARVEANISKVEGKLEWTNSKLERQRELLEELREKYNDTRSDEWRERYSSWIDECEEHIDDYKERIRRYKGWIEEEREKLR